jgi:hypothetical protein
MHLKLETWREVLETKSVPSFIIRSLEILCPIHLDMFALISFKPAPFSFLCSSAREFYSLAYRWTAIYGTFPMIAEK